MATTLRLALQSKEEMPEQTRVKFAADYAGGKNSEWAKYTPVALLDFTVKKEIADKWDFGKSYEVIIDEVIE